MEGIKQYADGTDEMQCLGVRTRSRSSPGTHFGNRPEQNERRHRELRCGSGQRNGKLLYMFYGFISFLFPKRLCMPTTTKVRRFPWPRKFLACGSGVTTASSKSLRIIS